jgi:hypothetical protein
MVSRCSGVRLNPIGYGATPVFKVQSARALHGIRQQPLIGLLGRVKVLNLANTKHQIF